MTRISFGKTALALTSLSALVTLAGLTGCAMGSMQLSGVPAVTPASITGVIHGGQQPVTGSTIQIYAAGSAGYGSAATPLLSGTVTSDSNGNFAITGLTCPTSSTLVYITATGGNPGMPSGTNSAIKMAATLGACGSIGSSTFITINEVTTAATAYALGQFFTPTFGSSSTDSFGAPSNTQAQTGITNAFATYNNMVVNATGTTVSNAVFANSLGTITATPESDRLYTIADILAACVNSDGGSASACQTTLFPDVTPTSGTQPTDTLQAAVLMSLNPTSNNASGSTANMAALYALQLPTSPFVGATTQPGDWTVGINYSAGATNATQTLINGANGLAIDSAGNIWIINLNSSATATESLAEFSPTGMPLANPFNSGATLPASMAAASPRNLAIDTNNDVFVTSSSSSGYVFEYSSGGVASSLAVGSQPYGISIDGSNNIFVSHNSGTSYGFEEYLGGTLAATTQVRYPFSSINQFATLDTSGNLFLAQGSTNSSAVLEASGMNPGTCTTFPCTTTNDASLTATYTSIASGSISNPYGMAAAKSGGIWVSDNGASNVTYISGGAGVAYGSTSSFTTPRFVAVDGANNAWFTNRGTTSVSEITPAGTILSPVMSGSTGTVGFFHAGMSTQSGIGIDPSGNVWISNGTNTGSASDQNSIFEIVGAGTPTVTPISLALKNGTVGARP